MNAVEPRGYEIFGFLAREALATPYLQQNLRQRIITMIIGVLEGIAIIAATPCILLYLLHLHNGDTIREINICGINIIFNQYRFL